MPWGRRYPSRAVSPGGGGRNAIKIKKTVMKLDMRALAAVGAKALEFIPRLSLIVAASGIFLMMVLIIAEVISTQIFNYSLPYVLEYSEYLIPIIVFWGASYTLSVGGHVRADIFFRRLSDNAREWFILIGFVLGLIFLVVVLRQMSQVAYLSIKYGRLSYYSSPSPIGPPQLFATIGLALFAVQLAVEICRKARRLYLRYRPGSLN